MLFICPRERTLKLHNRLEKNENQTHNQIAEKQSKNTER